MGAAAFGRVDEWSDIDICVDAADGRVEDVFPEIEGALEKLARVELKYAVPAVCTPGYRQAFYRLEGVSPFILLDLAVFEHSAADKYLEPEIHGHVVFQFNRGGRVRVPALDRRVFLEKLKARVEEIRLRRNLFGPFFEKELNRKNWIEAEELYRRLCLEPLVEVLRMHHRPERYSFGTRYIRYDLPEDVTGPLTELVFIRDVEDLKAKYARASAWLDELLRSLDWQKVADRLAGLQ
jgi:predicted nucleotidyltransferase